MNSSSVTINDFINNSLLSQVVTSELNEKSADGIADSIKDYDNKCQQFFL